MGKRFASVWDALPEGLRDSMPLQTDDEIESALQDAGTELARKHGFCLVRSRNGYTLNMPGRVLVVGQIEIANAAIRQAIKPTAAALAGAAGTVNLALPENALQAVWRAFPIATNNWTFSAEIATRTRDTKDGGLSNEF